MSSSPTRARRAAGLLAPVLVLLLGSAAAGPAADYPGIGRRATPSELRAWDIDVRPDFKGLPAGSGSVAQGAELWEAKCSSCHGSFGESNQVFMPLVGGTTADDIRTGHVARLLDPAFPARTTLMKLATVSTLWDYIHRAMPWTAPKSLQPDQVYALLAYLLSLADIVPDDFTLSDRNIAQVQQRMPNRKGMSTDHGFWPGQGLGNGGRPDVKATACMRDCAGVPAQQSSLPDFARNAHGNLAQQNRLVGAQHGADTEQPPPATLQAARALALAAAMPAAPASANAAPAELLARHGCSACHALDSRLVGPAFKAVARKYGARTDAVDYLAGKIRSGGGGLWGEITMPPQDLPPAEARRIAQWLAAGAER